MRRIPRWLALLLTGGLLAGCSATTTPGPGPTRSPQAGPGPGVSDTEIHVGFIVATTDANEQIGASGITSGDEGYQAKLMVEDINKNGGIAGRTLVPVFHGFDATSDEPVSLQEQGACTDFTQDRLVFAVFPANAGDDLKQCLQDAGVVAISENLQMDDASTYEEFPTYVEPGGISLDRIAAALVPALGSQGYFGSDPTVGIVTVDNPNFAHAVDEVLVPALAEAGFQVPAANIARAGQAQTTAEVERTSADISSALLRFKSNGVTHVIFLEAGGLLPFFFLPGAEQQEFHPRYAFTSNSGPQALLTGGNIPESQLAGAAGIGWTPALDLPFGSGPVDDNPQAQRCLDLMRAGGEEAPDANALTVQLLTCDQLWFFQAALEASGASTVNADTFLDGVARLGSSFESAVVGPTNFSDTQHDGVAAVADYQFSDACGCFEYTSEFRPIT